jgi:hypothetical protein
MKVGDWVLHDDGRVGRITALDFTPSYHLVMYDETFARMTPAQYLTVLEKPVSDILTAVNTN